MFSIEVLGLKPLAAGIDLSTRPLLKGEKREIATQGIDKTTAGTAAAR
jgi:hypothetical protein